VSHLLERNGEFRVVGTAIDGLEALARIRELAPDIALIDVGMPHVDGVEITRRLVEEGSPTRVLVYAGGRDAAVVLEALEAGAAGFALKDGELSELAHAATLVVGGGTYVDPHVMARLSTLRSERPPLLTPREREVLQLLSEGLRNDEVAGHLRISPLTVRTHVRHAMEKLGAGTRTEAVATALRLSLIR
jgi:DNA-binding NarL/FixJ family response regulator